MDNRVIAKAEKHTTQRPTGKKSWFRPDWLKCDMGWFTWNEKFSFSAFGASDG
jgi:hypothetical protein